MYTTIDNNIDNFHSNHIAYRPGFTNYYRLHTSNVTLVILLKCVVIILYYVFIWRPWDCRMWNFAMKRTGTTGKITEWRQKKLKKRRTYMKYMLKCARKPYFFFSVVCGSCFTWTLHLVFALCVVVVVFSFIHFECSIIHHIQFLFFSYSLFRSFRTSFRSAGRSVFRLQSRCDTHTQKKQQQHIHTQTLTLTERTDN